MKQQGEWIAWPPSADPIHIRDSSTILTEALDAICEYDDRQLTGKDARAMIDIAFTALQQTKG